MKTTNNMEQTLSIIKPDAVERNLADEIKNIFKKNNLVIKDSKKIHITKDEAAEFYKVHQAKPFYDQLCNYLSSGPIEVMILEGNNAVKVNRKLMGATNPKEAEEKSLSELKKLKTGISTVIICHRISTAKNADKILVLNKGKLEQIGTHKELICVDGFYKKTFELEQANLN